MTDVPIWSRALKLAREFRGVSQAELAEAIGVGQSSVTDWERGVCAPRPKRWRDICRALGGDPRAMLALTLPKDDPPGHTDSLAAQRAELLRVAPVLRQHPLPEKDKMIDPLNDEVSLRCWGIEQAMRKWAGGMQEVAGEDPVSLARRICDFVRGGRKPDTASAEPAPPHDPLSKAYRSVARLCGSEEKQ